MDRERQSLEDALVALKAGDKRTAAGLFSSILRANPNHADAWVGLALSTAKPERRKEYLQRALQVDPSHAYARSALARIEHGSLSPSDSKINPVVRPKNPKIQRKWLEVYIGLGLAVVLLFCVIGGMAIFLNNQVQGERIASLPVDPNSGNYVFIDFYADW